MIFVGLMHKQSSSQQSIQVFSSVGVPGQGASHFAGMLWDTPQPDLRICIRMRAVKGQEMSEIVEDTKKVTGMTCCCEGLHRRSLESAHLAEEL